MIGTMIIFKNWHGFVRFFCAQLRRRACADSTQIIRANTGRAAKRLLSKDFSKILSVKFQNISTKF